MLQCDSGSTGISGLDTILNGIRWGDNIVWHVENIQDYQEVVVPFVEHAIANNIPVIYLRFGQHAPLIQGNPNIKEYQLDADLGFEAFTRRVYTIVSEEGEGVCYVFDSLSDLLSKWATDLMIGNFFQVTCPYLLKLNAIAYFAIIKYSHSYATVTRIRETTQLLLNLFRAEDYMYIHPRKVGDRYSPTMFFPHIRQGDRFVPITSSAETVDYLHRFDCRGPGNVERKLDRWDRIFLAAQELTEVKNKGSIDYKKKESTMVDRLCRMVLGHDERILSLARKYFSIDDILKIRHRLVGSGYIGGKAVGMLLARKILESDTEMDWSDYLEPQDSFYIGSDVYNTYLVENNCWELFQQQKLSENYFTLAKPLRDKILNGIMPEVFSDQIKLMLDYFGQSPVIIRSSSLLEDGFGNAFAGKYESIFCVNQGSPQERYKNFEKAVKSIYASTMNENALTYRLQRGLADRNEQMALLVQRVSGTLHSNYFFPDLAGVALSRNPYTWHKSMDSRAGMVRLVLGLGTRAVDRVDDYPRILALDKPTLRPESSPEDMKRFSQRKVDVLDITNNKWTTINLDMITRQMSRLSWWEAVAKTDYHKINIYKEIGREAPEAWILTYDEFLKGYFPERMRDMLRTLEQAYSCPVDTEFTINFNMDGGLSINLLQCRPLKTIEAAQNRLPSIDYDEKDVFFTTHRNTMGGGLQQEVERIVYIPTVDYINLSVQDKYQVGSIIGNLNRLFEEQGKKHYMLIGPGRWGSSIPSLGVPVSFAEICNASVLVEVAQEEKGLMPEVSFGTHFFQDLVENKVVYVGLFPNKENVIFNTDKLQKMENRFAHCLPEYNKWQSVIQVFDLSENKLRIDVDIKNQKTVCYFC